MRSMDDPLIKAIKGMENKSNTINIVKKAVAERCALPEDMVTLNDCVNILLGITFNVMITSGNPKHMFIDVFNGILPGNTYHVSYFHDKCPISMQSDPMPRYDVLEAVIYKCVSLIRLSDIEHLYVAKSLGER